MGKKKSAAAGYQVCLSYVLRDHTYLAFGVVQVSLKRRVLRDPIAGAVGVDILCSPSTNTSVLNFARPAEATAATTYCTLNEPHPKANRQPTERFLKLTIPCTGIVHSSITQPGLTRKNSTPSILKAALRTMRISARADLLALTFYRASSSTLAAPTPQQRCPCR